MGVCKHRRISGSPCGRHHVVLDMIVWMTVVCGCMGWMDVAAFVVPVTRSRCFRIGGLSMVAEEQVDVEGMTLKIAIDRKGNVGDASKDFGRFTSEDSLDMVHRLRAQCQGVLVGRVTVERDDCTLTVRRNVSCPQQPTRLILDPQLSLLSSSNPYKVFTHSDAPTVIYHTLSTNQAQSIHQHWRQQQQQQQSNPPQDDHVTLVSIPSSGKQNETRMDPKDIWNHITQTLQMKHILIEGGPMTAKLFLPIVDRILLVQANHVEFTKQPIPLNMSIETISKTHIPIGNHTSSITNDDTWYYFSKDAKWPTDNLQEWP